MLVMCKTGKYKVEIYDRQQNRYLPSVSGLGMHVDVKDPEDKTVLSRVSILALACLQIRTSIFTMRHYA